VSEAHPGLKNLRGCLKASDAASGLIRATALLIRDATLSPKERIGVSLVLAQKPWLLQLFEGYRRALGGGANAEEREGDVGRNCRRRLRRLD